MFFLCVCKFMATWMSMVTIGGPFVKFIGSCERVHCGVVV